MTQYRGFASSSSARDRVTPDLGAQPARAPNCCAHTPLYIDAVIDGTLDAREQRRIGFPWSPAMAERARRSVGATIAATRQALSDGVAANLAGGTHHAYADHGEGYCVFNDVAVSARLAQRELGISRALVVDLDVHQGNGTAKHLRGR